MKVSHELYLRAVNNPLRRSILAALTRGNASIEELKTKTNLDVVTLKWHLNVLISGLCVEKGDENGELVFQLTKYRKVVDYLK
jgi:predicted transcriptional regulator